MDWIPVSILFAIIVYFFYMAILSDLALAEFKYQHSLYLKELNRQAQVQQQNNLQQRIFNHQEINQSRLDSTNQKLASIQTNSLVEQALVQQRRGRPEQLSHLDDSTRTDFTTGLAQQFNNEHSVNTQPRLRNLVDSP